MWKCSPWALLPLVYSVCTAAGLWVVYFVAVRDERIAPLGSQQRRRNESFYPPFISIAGNYPPASCIFSEVMNLAAFVGFIIAVLRYLQLKGTAVRPCLNTFSLVVFSVGCFGMTLVGNFQVFTEEMIHNVGTLLTFGLGSLFCWLQSYITLKANLRNEGRRVAAVRFLLSVSITSCIFVHYALLLTRHPRLAARWQWALVMFFLAFFATFAADFRHSRFSAACADDVGPSETHSEGLRYQTDQL